MHSDLVGANSQDAAKLAVAHLFISQQMTLAYAMQTGVDLAVYVVTLQLVAQDSLTSIFEE